MKQFAMLSGLPRSGSTVLASMLNQHPKIYASTTSPVADMVDATLNLWPNISRALVQPDSHQFGNIVNGVIQGAYSHIEKEIVIDKNRLWPRFSPSLTQITGVRPKIICTVRDIPDILASYIILINNQTSNTNFVDTHVIQSGLPVTIKNRCKILWENYINHPYTSLQIGFNNQAADLLFCEYNDIINKPQETIDRICNFLDVESYSINVNNLQKMKEHDDFHGGLTGLHDIRPVLSKTSPAPEKIISNELVKMYSDMKLDFWRREARKIKFQPPPTKLAGFTMPNPTENIELPGDSLDYDLLYRAVTSAKNVHGLICEIGVRRGGSLRYIIDAIEQEHDQYRHIIAIDPYGNIDYAATEQFTGKLDYTNDMKNESLPNLYRYVQGKHINLVFYNLEDIEFFDRFSWGVPVYAENKYLINEYACVFFDGPHDLRSLKIEIDFFIPKTNIGSVFVFDDVASYPHSDIHNYILENGFDVLEIGSENRKISYRKIKN